MNDKSEITYWLVQPGEELSTAINITRTKTVKVPEVGEVINLNTSVNYDDLYIRFRHLKPEQVDRFLGDKESHIKGDFVVCNVKRWLKTRYYGGKLSELLSVNSGTGTTEAEVPVSYETETFEVYVQPFRNTELTETPIAKLRNKLGPLYGYIQILKHIKEKEVSIHEVKDLLPKLEDDAIKHMDEVMDLVRDKKIWK